MNSTPQIFRSNLINSHLQHFTKDNVPNFEEKFKEIIKWCNATAEKHLDRTKETAVQGAFMTRLFNQVFGYLEVIDDSECYHQERESKTVLDTTESDGALGFYHKSTGKKDIRVVVELKDARTPLDKKQHRSNHLSPVEQAFSYANKNGSKCAWVIVSNFVETRLYRSTSSLEYETFDMRKMKDEKEFLRFYYFLCKDHLIAENGRSLIDQLYQENEAEGIEITNQFYRTYKEIRNNLFTSLKENNSDKDDLMLFTKSQKLMDRLTFICFCEDCGLLPQNTFSRLVETAKQSFSFSSNKLWDQLRGLFAAIDRGNPSMGINQFNGGLFKDDPDLDSLMIPDGVLETFSQLSTYDFNSDLNVNILGHIFEQSISDVEQIKNEINGTESNNVGKQKEDGIYYTPYYVTRYIVEQTVGLYLTQKKEELKQSIFSEGDVVITVYKESTKRDHKYKFREWVEVPEKKENLSEDEEMNIKAVKGLHLHYWNAYENILKSIKICDPACGSGAFLNQCFDYLHEEMDFILGMKSQFTNQPSFFDINKQILQNNLYGVDINPESVEITKLSLWLKTAKNDQTLATLDDNIKCGNSIISDKGVVDNAFDWETSFPDVFNNGGFDIIVGNPPYGATVDSVQKEYISNHYSTFEGLFDTYKIFFELGIKLLKEDGYLGYITPNTYFELKKSGKKLRQFLFSNTLLKIVELYNVFPTAIVEPVISIYRKATMPSEKMEIILVPRKTHLSSTFENDGIHIFKEQNALFKNEDLSFIYKIEDEAENMIDEIQSKTKPISYYCKVFNGAKPYCKNKGNPLQTQEMVNQKIYNGYSQIDKSWVKYYRGKSIRRFTDSWNGEYIKYGENLAEPRDPSIFFREKIFIRQTGDSIIAMIDNGNVANNTLHIVFPKDDTVRNKYMLGLLNSTFMSWYYRAVHPLEVGKPMAEVKKRFIEELPLAIGSEQQQKDLENVVDHILTLCHKRYEMKKIFLKYLMRMYEPKKITEKLESFDTLSFKEFCQELKKQKVKLSASAQMDLMLLFDEKAQEVAEISSQICDLQTQLDEIVFQIYEIDIESAKHIKEKMVIAI